MDSFLGNDPLDPPLSQGAGLNEIRAFFPLDSPAAADPAAKVAFDDNEFDNLEWPQHYEFDNDMAFPRPRDEYKGTPPPPYAKRPSQPPMYAAGSLPQVEEVAETADSAPRPVIPSPPASRLYNTYDELLAFLQTFHRNNGTALQTERSSNAQIINGERVNTYRALVCDRAGSKASTSAGIRQSSSQQTGCPYKITVSATKSSN